MKIKVWHIPQIPGPAFELIVDTYAEAKLLHEALAQYDNFQFENDIKPDYSNAAGIQVHSHGEWVDWEPSDVEERILNRLFPGKSVDSLDCLSLAEVKQFEAARRVHSTSNRSS